MICHCYVWNKSTGSGHFKRNIGGGGGGAGKGEGLSGGKKLI